MYEIRQDKSEVTEVGIRSRNRSTTTALLLQSEEEKEGDYRKWEEGEARANKVVGFCLNITLSLSAHFAFVVFSLLLLNLNMQLNISAQQLEALTSPNGSSCYGNTCILDSCTSKTLEALVFSLQYCHHLIRQKHPAATMNNICSTGEKSMSWHSHKWKIISDE